MSRRAPRSWMPISRISPWNGAWPRTRSKATRATSSQLAGFAAGTDHGPARAGPRRPRSVRARADDRGPIAALGGAQHGRHPRLLQVSGRRRPADGSPAADVRAPRAWKTLPKYLSVDEVDALLAQPDVSTPRGLRDRALIELLYATGLRVSELVGLRPTDVNLEASFVTCTGKGGKERAVPIGDQAARWIARYLRDGRPTAAAAAGPARGCSSTRAAAAPGSRASGFWKILRGYAAGAGLRRAAQPARAAALVRHAPARARRRSPRRSR